MAVQTVHCTTLDVCMAVKEAGVGGIHIAAYVQYGGPVRKGQGKFGE